MAAGLLGFMVKAPAHPTIFVDGRIPTVFCANYDPARRACGNGTNAAYRTIGATAAGVVPGVTVCIRGGTYHEALVPPASGAPDLPITYRGYPGETVTITGASFDPAIDLSNRGYIVLEGLTVTNVVGWLRAEQASHNIIRHCVFLHATARGSRAGLRFVAADFNRIVANDIEDGHDNLCLIDSNYNVVESNRFRRGRHALWNILCGNYNVLRNNSFANEIQKIGQITDCEGIPTGAPFKYDATKRNLVEGNTFECTPSSGDSAPYAGIQYSAQKGIIRRNWFYDTTGPGMEMTLYGEEARYNTDSRVYENVFYGTRFAGVQICEASSNAFGGHIFKNNVFYKSVFAANDTRWPWYANQLACKPIQVMAGRLDGYLFEQNDILGAVPGQPGAVTYGSRFSPSNPPQRDLAWWQSNYPGLFTNNIEAPPSFLDEEARNFRLQPRSPLIAAGAFLTRTIGAGRGNVIPVADASYFYDGYGIPGEAGDMIQLEGQTNAARIVHIDEAANTLTLDQPLAWAGGQGVALPFQGVRPDLGDGAAHAAGIEPFPRPE